MRHGIRSVGRYGKIGAALASVVLLAGLAGWGGSTIALAGAGASSAASESAAGARPAVGQATSDAVARPTDALPSTPSGSTGSASSPARPTGAVPQTTSAPSSGTASPSTPPRGTASASGPRPPTTYEPDIVFVDASGDSFGGGQWHYRVGLIGFPADAVVEIRGYDSYGNVRVAPLAMTTAEGSWDPFTTGFGMLFAYGGTCSTAQPNTVTARGHGFSVTETVPRPLECDGGTTGNGPWARPIHPVPVPTQPPTASP